MYVIPKSKAEAKRVGTVSWEGGPLVPARLWWCDSEPIR